MERRRAVVAVLDIEEAGDPVILSHIKHTLEDGRVWTLYPFKKERNNPSFVLIEVVTSQAQGLGAYVIVGLREFARPLLPYIRKRFTIQEVKTSDHPLAQKVRQAWKAKYGDSTDYKLRRVVANYEADPALERNEAWEVAE